MKKVITFVSDIRVNALICCSAAVLLTACGGGAGTAAQPTQTAAEVGSGAANPSETTVAAPAPAAADQEGTDSPEAAVPPPAAPAPVPAPVPAPAPAPAAATPAAAAPSAATVAPAPVIAPAQPASLTAPAAPASTTHLYVATTGSDSNPGTAAAPFRTINKAAGAAKPSTTVHVAPGTYSGNVTTKVHGTASARIRYVSDVKWGAKIVGSGAEGMWTNNANYTDIVGFDITGPGRLGIVNWASFTLVQGNHIHDLTISGGCTGNGGAGVVNANYGGSDGDIIGNVVHDIGKPGACNGVQGIYSSNLRGRILNNIVYRASAFGIHLWHAASGVTIANNTVFQNGSSGMGGGIVIGNGDSPGGTTLKDTIVINNIVYKNPGVGIKHYCYSGQSCIGFGNVTANNLVYGNGSGISLKTGTATGTLTVDPQFVNYQADGSGDYRLQGSSPAINKGTAASAPTWDIDNAARPLGGAIDIGAYESL